MEAIDFGASRLLFAAHVDEPLGYKTLASANDGEVLEDGARHQQTLAAAIPGDEGDAGRDSPAGAAVVLGFTGDLDLTRGLRNVPEEDVKQF